MPLEISSSKKTELPPSFTLWFQVSQAIPPACACFLRPSRSGHAIQSAWGLTVHTSESISERNADGAGCFSQVAIGEDLPLIALYAFQSDVLNLQAAQANHPAKLPLHY